MSQKPATEKIQPSTKNLVFLTSISSQFVTHLDLLYTELFCDIC